MVIKSINPNILLREKQLELQISALDAKRAEIKAQTETPEWRKKMEVAHIEAQKKRLQLRKKINDYGDMN